MSDKKMKTYEELKAELLNRVKKDKAVRAKNDSIAPNDVKQDAPQDAPQETKPVESPKDTPVEAIQESLTTSTKVVEKEPTKVQPKERSFDVEDKPVNGGKVIAPKVITPKEEPKQTAEKLKQESSAPAQKPIDSIDTLRSRANALRKMADAEDAMASQREKEDKENGLHAASPSRLRVYRTYSKDGKILKEEQTEDVIETPMFATKPAVVGYDLGTTINMGNCESIKVLVSVFLPCYVGEHNEAFLCAKSFVNDTLSKEVAAIKKV